MKNVEFCRKTSKLLPKSCLFIFCIFYLNEKELNQQVFLIKYVENEISNPTSHKKKREREDQKHNPTSKTFLKLLNIFHCLQLSNYNITFTTCGQTLTKI